LVGEVEPWRVDEVFLFWTDNADYWEDVTASMDRRIAALKRHQSQLGERVDQVEERIRKMARVVGEKAGFEYAEGFKRIVFH
jgi:LmbE family N-acetylglucosaminyl deacetylase